jgi:hypothetical protein
MKRGDSRLLPKRSAKRKALQAIKANGEHSDSEQEGMEVDFAEDDDDEDEGIVWDDPEEMDDSSRPTTRSMQRGVQDSPGSQPKQVRRSSRHSVIDIDVEQTAEEMLAPNSPLTPAPHSMSMDVDGEGENDEDGMQVEDSDDAGSRTTRSGRAFGAYQSRRTRLRQEAMDDPDMAELEGVDEDEEEDEDDDDFEAGELVECGKCNDWRLICRL